MKKTTLIIFLITLCGFFSGCNTQEDVTDKRVNYLNSHKATISTFFSDDDNFYKINGYSVSYQDFDSISDYNYIVYVIDCSEHADKLSVNLLDLIYETLDSNDNVMVLFIGAENYDFFENTKFSNEKGYYGDNVYVKGFYNFSLHTQGIVEIDTYFEYENESNRLYEATLTVFERRVREHIGAQ